MIDGAEQVDIQPSELNMRRLLTFALIFGSASAFAAPVPKKLKKRDGIVGVWKLELLTYLGTVSPAIDVSNWTIDDNFALTRVSKQKGSPPSLTQLRIVTATKEIDWLEERYLGGYELSEDRRMTHPSRI
jgi:hypothetical protein